MNPKLRLAIAWTLLVGSLVLWPVSMLTFARDEPPVVLSLSWFAITLTAADLVSTQDVRRQQEDGDGDHG